jgi:type IV secretion system protein VirD4
VRIALRVLWWLLLPLTGPAWLWARLDGLFLEFQMERAHSQNQADLSSGLRFFSWCVLAGLIFAEETRNGCYQSALASRHETTVYMLFFVHSFFAAGIIGSVCGGFLRWLSGPKTRRVSTHGSADFRTNFSGRFLAKGEPRHGSAVGHFPDGVADRKLENFVYVDQHVLTVASTGSGKGTGCVIPQLLLSDISTIVLDPKGENFAITARARRAKGHDIVCMDPYGVTGAATTSLNPLLAIDVESEHAVSDAQELAATLIVRGQESDSHWSDSAQRLLEMAILCEAARGGDLVTVRDLLTEGEEAFDRELRRISEQRGLAGGAPARIARSHLARDRREASGVLSTLHRHLAFLDDPILARSLQGSTFRFDVLRERPVDVFVALPPHKMGVASRWIRLVLGTALARMSRTEPTRPVQFVIDEFPALGRFDAFESAISMMRGYRVSFWFLVQDLSQLRGVYPRWETFVSNSTVQAFGIQSESDAELFSKMSGETTVTAQSSGTSRGSTLSRSQGTSEVRRRLFTPDEVRRLDPAECLVFEPGQRMAVLYRPTYYAVPELADMADAPRAFAR